MHERVLETHRPLLRTIVLVRTVRLGRELQVYIAPVIGCVESQCIPPVEA
jgi:hypothetical protein